MGLHDLLCEHLVTLQGDTHAGCKMVARLKHGVIVSSRLDQG